MLSSYPQLGNTLIRTLILVALAGTLSEGCKHSLNAKDRRAIAMALKEPPKKPLVPDASTEAAPAAEAPPAVSEAKPTPPKWHLPIKSCQQEKRWSLVEAIKKASRDAWDEAAVCVQAKVPLKFTTDPATGKEYLEIPDLTIRRMHEEMAIAMLDIFHKQVGWPANEKEPRRIHYFLRIHMRALIEFMTFKMTARDEESGEAIISLEPPQYAVRHFLNALFAEVHHEHYPCFPGKSKTPVCGGD